MLPESFSSGEYSSKSCCSKHREAGGRIVIKAPPQVLLGLVIEPYREGRHVYTYLGTPISITSGPKITEQ